MTPCSSVEVHRGSTETSVNLYRATRLTSYNIVEERCRILDTVSNRLILMGYIDTHNQYIVEDLIQRHKTEYFVYIKI
jgi:hypothetical protein